MICKQIFYRKLYFKTHLLASSLVISNFSIQSK